MVQIAASKCLRDRSLSFVFSHAGVESCVTNSGESFALNIPESRLTNSRESCPSTARRGGTQQSDYSGGWRATRPIA
jgi:hypothetical protein